MSAAPLIPGQPDVFEDWTADRAVQPLAPPLARFTREPNTWSWISDIEHALEETTGEPFIADVPRPYYWCGDRIPGGRNFELFPYHYYDKVEEDILARRINYTLRVKNIVERDVTVEIFGMGTTRDWDHYKTWEGALRGDGKQTFTLKPGEERVLWEEKQLVGDLPWSGIILGKADGDLWVCDYIYLGDTDPGYVHAEPQPDLAWPPYLLASYTRGGVDWNAARIDLFPERRDPGGRLPLAAIGNGAWNMAFGYSPGGPITNLCEYKAMEPTFPEDVLSVLDPVSGKEHLFFGGNYPIMYKFRLPVVNDSTERKSIRFYLCSNDKFNVDTIAGVWIQERMLACRVPMVSKNKQWRIFTLTLDPGEESEAVDFIVVPLGSRWGGMIGTVEITSEP